MSFCDYLFAVRAVSSICAFDASQCSANEFDMAAFEYKCREYFWCVSLMGQFPVILTKDGCFPSRLLRVYGVVLSIVYTGITIYILNNVSVVSGDIFYFVIIRVLPFIGHLLTLHSTLMPSWRANWMCEIFARLNVIDKSLSNFGYEASYFWHRVIPLFVLAIYSAYLGIVVLLEILFPWWIDTFPQYSYYFFWTNYIMFFIMITLIVMIHFIVIRFRFINQKLILLQTASSFIGQKVRQSFSVFFSFFSFSFLFFSCSPTNLLGYKPDVKSAENITDR